MNGERKAVILGLERDVQMIVEKGPLHLDDHCGGAEAGRAAEGAAGLGAAAAQVVPLNGRENKEEDLETTTCCR